jgi:hypothetical protein
VRLLKLTRDICIKRGLSGKHGTNGNPILVQIANKMGLQIYIHIYTHPLLTCDNWCLSG